MTYEELYNKIRINTYNSKLHYPSYDEVQSGKISKEKDREMKNSWREDERKLKKIFVNDLKKYCEEELNKELSQKQFTSIYNFAWANGHSSGYEEVLIYATEILEVVRNFVK